MHRRLFLITTIAALVGARALAQAPAAAPSKGAPALRAQVSASLEKGFGFLEKQQRAESSWNGENGRWMEKDPNLVTTYCLLALAYIHDRL